MRGSAPVRRVPHAMTAEKLGADSDILPQTVQQHQKLIHIRKRRRRMHLPCYRFFRRGSNGGRRTRLDERRGRFGFGTYTIRSVLFEALKVLTSIYALYILTKWWLLGTQQQGFDASTSSHLSRPIAVVIRTHTSQKSSQFYMPLPMKSWAKEEAEYVDYGELDIHIFEEDGQQRNIYHDFNQDLDGGDDSIEAAADDEHDYYYAFDDDTKRNPYIGWDDKNLQSEKQCRRVNWHRLLLLNCNSFHELGLASNAVANFSFMGAGSYREVFTTDQPFLNDTETIIFKEYVYSDNYSYEDYEFMRMDALVSERLTSSPQIVDIYGFCGLSMMSEHLSMGTLMAHATPGGDRGRPVELNDSEDVDPKNYFSASEKLTLSLEMAEAIALLHSYKGGVIVHDDIQLSQFLCSEEGYLKLNDFNRAEIMLWNEKDQEYCRYRNNPGEGDWRAPEEFMDKPLNEKIDVWSLGMNMYALLTGVNPFYNELEVEVVQQKVVNGEKPYIDPRYRSRSFAEGKLVEIIERCWTYDADERPDIFEIARLLKAAYELDKHHQTDNGEMNAVTVENGTLPISS